MILTQKHPLLSTTVMKTIIKSIELLFKARTRGNIKR